jgi:hypothetical protein
VFFNFLNLLLLGDHQFSPVCTYLLM